MKKYILPAAIIIIVLVLAGAGFAYLSSKNKTKAPEKSTKEIITELLSKKYNRQPDSMIIGVTADTGTFAKGTYNEPAGGGGLWFAAKTAAGWELAFDGNGIAPCMEISKYNFPKDIIPTCLDIQNNNNLIKR